jgi:hypothetical protein
MNDDDVRVEYNSDENAGDFLDAMAKTLAESLKFGNHGPLSVNEQTAFLWGFRYGIHQMNALLSQASGKDEKTFYMIADIMTNAVKEWQLKATAQIAAVIPLGKPAKETEH